MAKQPTHQPPSAPTPNTHREQKGPLSAKTWPNSSRSRKQKEKEEGEQERKKEKEDEQCRPSGPWA